MELAGAARFSEAVGRHAQGDELDVRFVNDQDARPRQLGQRIVRRPDAGRATLFPTPHEGDLQLKLCLSESEGSEGEKKTKAALQYKTTFPRMSNTFRPWEVKHKIVFYI